MATPKDVLDAAMLLVSNLAEHHRRADPGFHGPHPSTCPVMYEEVERGAYERWAYERLLLALADPSMLSYLAETVAGNSNGSLPHTIPPNDTDAWGAFWRAERRFPEGMTVDTQTYVRAIERISRRLESDAGLARAYADMAILVLGALHTGNLKQELIVIDSDPTEMTYSLMAVPIVFPRIEVKGDSASLLYDIRLGHISSQEGYDSWVSELESANTTVIKLQPRHFAPGILAVIRRKLARRNIDSIRVKSGRNDSMSVSLDERSRSYKNNDKTIAANFWQPAAYASDDYPHALCGRVQLDYLDSKLRAGGAELPWPRAKTPQR